MAAPYARVQARQFPALEERQTPEARFWSKFQYPIVVKQTHAVSHVDFSPVAPHDYAVTTGSSIVLHDGRTNKEKKSITRFKEPVFSGTYRADGRLLACGTSKGGVCAVDVSSKAVLRTFMGHTAAVRTTRFVGAGGAGDATSVFSSGDDATVRMWDVSTGECTAAVEGAHGDYVRSSAVPFGGGAGGVLGSGVVATGSYDHTLRLWDLRSLGGGTGAASQRGTVPRGCILSVDHGEPVTSVLVLAGGLAVLSAGSNYCRVWDVVGGGRLLHSFSSHTKLITSVSLDGTGTRLVSAGLDGLVKVRELGSYSVTHTQRFPGQLLAVALPPDNSRLAVGAADGTLWVRQRIVRLGEVLLERKEAGVLRSGSYRYFLRGRGGSAGVEDVTAEGSGDRKPKLKAWDIALKGFNHGAALDAALASGSASVTAAVLRELVARQALTASLIGRSEDSLEPLLRFLCGHIAQPRFAGLCADVAGVVMDTFAHTLTAGSGGTLPQRGGGRGGAGAGGGGEGLLASYLHRLLDAVGGELRLGHDLLALQGQLEVLMAAGAHT